MTTRFQVVFCNFLQGQGEFWTTSQLWHQNSFRNHDRTICLLLNWANVFYTKQRQYCVVFNGIVWYCMVFCCSLGCCIILYDITRLCRVLYGICIELYGIIDNGVLYYISCFFIIVLCGIIRYITVCYCVTQYCFILHRLYGIARYWRVFYCIASCCIISDGIAKYSYTVL